MGKQKSGRKGRGTRRVGAGAAMSGECAPSGLVGPPGRDQRKALSRGAEPPLTTITHPSGMKRQTSAREPECPLRPRRASATSPAGGGGSNDVVGGGGRNDAGGGGGSGGDGFVFEMDARRFRYSDAELLEDLRAFGEVVGGRPFAQMEFNRWEGARCRAEPITRRFGTWRAALAAAGIEGGQGRSYEPAELMERLEKAWRRLGRRPGTKVLMRAGNISPRPFVRQWGSVERACELLMRFKRGEISREQMLAPGTMGVRRMLKPGVRWEVLVRDGHRCRGCGRGADEKGVRLEVDHIVPVCAGGTDEISNLRALCYECTRGKGGKMNVKRWRGRRRGGRQGRWGGVAPARSVAGARLRVREGRTSGPSGAHRSVAEALRGGGPDRR